MQERERARPILEDELLGRRSLASIVDLHALLVGDASFKGFADALEHLPEAEDDWGGAWRAARDAAVDDSTGIAVAFLLAERSTSHAWKSPLAVALTIATAEWAGLDGGDDATRSSPATVERARYLVDAHRYAFSAFFAAQKHLTVELFDGAARLNLLRGVRRFEPHQGPGPVPLALRPLSSWTASEETARGIVLAPDAAGGGPYLWVFSADVPLDRVLSTSVTGFGAPFESEVVLIGGRAGDSCTVVDCLLLEPGSTTTE
jgi:hypothetical protein